MSQGADISPGVDGRVYFPSVDGKLYEVAAQSDRDGSGAIPT